MSRRLPAISLLCAWLCASGAALDMAQLFAWTNMFAGYARTESISQAVKETFDPAKPCAICKAVSQARTESDRHSPAVSSAGAERLILIFERPSAFVAAATMQSWPRVGSDRAEARVGEVAVPPPRGSGATELS